jgi:hypothetical protein
VSVESDLARAVNAASWAAANEVYEYAHRFKRREEYRPLEDLAQRVQHAAVTAAFEVINETADAGETGRAGEEAEH